MLQEHLIREAQKLPFLTTMYPISWLKFEEELLRRRSDRKAHPLSTKREEVVEWAEQCGVPDFSLALQFFHDTGLIIDQGESTIVTHTCISRT